jgi:hypothetical protein
MLRCACHLPFSCFLFHMISCGFVPTITCPHEIALMWACYSATGPGRSVAAGPSASWRVYTICPVRNAVRGQPAQGSHNAPPSPVPRVLPPTSPRGGSGNRSRAWSRSTVAGRAPPASARNPRPWCRSSSAGAPGAAGASAWGAAGGAFLVRRCRLVLTGAAADEMLSMNWSPRKIGSRAGGAPTPPGPTHFHSPHSTTGAIQKSRQFC